MPNRDPTAIPKKHLIDKRAHLIIAASADADPDELLTTKQTAALLNMSRQWLEIGRCKGYGPPFHKMGRLTRYRRGDLNTWLGQCKHRCTAEYIRRPSESLSSEG